MQIVLYIMLAVLVLMLMILIHEAGHYTAGKLLGFRIDEFSVGFGPKIIEHVKKNGEKITLRAFPIGGYCAFCGEDESVPNEAAKNKAAETVAFDQLPIFNMQPPWKRIIVLLSGAFFNLISAVIFSFIYIFAVGYVLPVVSDVYTDGITPYSALMTGDVIVAVDGKDIGVLSSYDELTSGLVEGDEVTLTVMREGARRDIPIEYKKIVANGDTYVGAGFARTYISVSGNPTDAFVCAVPYTAKLSLSILGAFGKIVTGQIALTELSGPIGTVTAIAEYSMLDWRYILVFLPLIAGNLAVFNLLPIPSLDGMRVLFVAVEAIRKKPINRKIENTINVTGLILLLCFVILIDIIGLFVR